MPFFLHAVPTYHALTSPLAPYFDGEEDWLAGLQQNLKGDKILWDLELAFNSKIRMEVRKSKSSGDTSRSFSFPSYTTYDERRWELIYASPIAESLSTMFDYKTYQKFPTRFIDIEVNHKLELPRAFQRFNSPLISCSSELCYFPSRRIIRDPARETELREAIRSALLRDFDAFVTYTAIVLTEYQISKCGFDHSRIVQRLLAGVKPNQLSNSADVDAKHYVYMALNRHGIEYEHFMCDGAFRSCGPLSTDDGDLKRLREAETPLQVTPESYNLQFTASDPFI
jgi:hypothetical protein